MASLKHQALSHAELEALSFGPGYVKYRPDWPDWRIDDGLWLRPLWERHHAEVMARWVRPGQRPWAWWAFNSRDPRNPAQGEAYQLAELGELADAEIAELTPEWRRHYDRSFDEHFSFALGPGEFLEGEEGRQALYRWAGIPRAILDRWEAERARRSGVIHRLKPRK